MIFYFRITEKKRYRTVICNVYVTIEKFYDLFENKTHILYFI